MKIYQEKKDDSIPVREMEDGQIGVIAEWSTQPMYVGVIIQRYNNYLVALGKPYVCSWYEITDNHGCRVRILQPGTLLEV